MTQVNVIVVHIRAEQAPEYERLFAEHELRRWRAYHADGKFVSARFFRSQYGNDERPDVLKYVIIAEVPTMAEHHAHDSDPGFQEFDRLVDFAARAAARLWRRPDPRRWLRPSSRLMKRRSRSGFDKLTMSGTARPEPVEGSFSSAC
jgi:hypothetical protein